MLLEYVHFSINVNSVWVQVGQMILWKIRFTCDRNKFLTDDGTGGALRRPGNAGLEKSAGFAYPLCPFLSILVENGSQDGSQNRSKIDQNRYEKNTFF